MCLAKRDGWGGQATEGGAGFTFGLEHSEEIKGVQINKTQSDPGTKSDSVTGVGDRPMVRLVTDGDDLYSVTKSPAINIPAMECPDHLMTEEATLTMTHCTIRLRPDSVRLAPFVFSSV